jgi:hypothetical protein
VDIHLQLSVIRVNSVLRLSLKKTTWAVLSIIAQIARRKLDERHENINLEGFIFWLAINLLPFPIESVEDCVFK